MIKGYRLQKTFFFLPSTIDHLLKTNIAVYTEKHITDSMSTLALGRRIEKNQCTQTQTEMTRWEYFGS